MPDAQIDPAIAADLAALAIELSHNKDTRKEFGRLVRKVKPDSKHANAFADVDQEDRFERFRQEQEDRELKRQQDAIVASMNERRAGLLEGTGGRKYSEDDVKAIEALMQKKGITDYDDGATLYAATLPPVTKPEAEVPKHGATWEFPAGSEDFFKDSAKASRNVAHQVIGEFMRKRG